MIAGPAEGLIETPATVDVSAGCFSFRAEFNCRFFIVENYLPWRKDIAQLLSDSNSLATPVPLYGPQPSGIEAGGSELEGRTACYLIFGRD